MNVSKIENMINYINSSKTPKNKAFNEFAVEFYLETRDIPLSKFLKVRNYTSKTPKIMNTKKAGELIIESKNNPKILTFLNDNGYNDIPELNYSAIMLLRKVTPEKNWKKVIKYLKGQGTIDEINRKNKKTLLPEDKENIEIYLKEKLEITSDEFHNFLNLYSKIINNKELKKSINKLV
ncbi:hypothetical protein EV215_2089 [Hypnocyclicus thermotrophus]|uniref:Uncharacterized protein n=1 Tax=Hypnocyclicus thermotrophus TaxID=1627895 RepID=A0AA46DWS8_9FUSO|nr:hypothetical protein [Hypnocyclicus thermotrophus]TDT66994.1 hypothetical protein EV215_2089 [Hypnocyclicus thermotrophus]